MTKWHNANTMESLLAHTHRRTGAQAHTHTHTLVHWANAEKPTTTARERRRQHKRSSSSIFSSAAAGRSQSSAPHSFVVVVSSCADAARSRWLAFSRWCARPAGAHSHTHAHTHTLACVLCARRPSTTLGAGAPLALSLASGDFLQARARARLVFLPKTLTTQRAGRRSPREKHWRRRAGNANAIVRRQWLSFARVAAPAGRRQPDQWR